MEAYVSVKGQIVIPSAIRRQFGIKEGTRIHIEVDNSRQRIVLTPITEEYVKSLRGKLKGKGLLNALKAEKELERKR